MKNQILQMLKISKTTTQNIYWNKEWKLKIKHNREMSHEC